MSSIFRFAEPVSPSGGLQAQGLVNLLGAPPMDPITLVLREAAQNAWDARCAGLTPRMLVRVRALAGNQGQAFRQFLLTGTEVTGEPRSMDHLTARLSEADEKPVLEICDFGTEGLSGSPDPVRESSRFVRFFFDIGSPHFDGSTGGTYGFGRASLYLASAVRTIVVDTQPAAAGSLRRFMACRLGDSYVSERADNRGDRHTGRHFWGASGSDRSVLPIEGREAEQFAAALGLPRRSQPSESGTSIIIPWPELDPKTAHHFIPDILYHHLWPKLVPVDGAVPMELWVDFGSGEQLLSLSRANPVYEGFAAALATARKRRSPAIGIGPKTRRNPTAHVAACPAAHIRFDEKPGDPEFPDPMDVFRNGFSHVALMRASELVVTYRHVDLGADAPPWVGVVLADSAPEVASAFAAAEPPAHDDWNPAKLKGPAGTIVRMTLKRIREGVQEFLGVKPAPLVAGTDAPSLVDAADYFSEQFISGDGSGAGHTGGGGGGGSSRRPRVITGPTFVGLDQLNGLTVARYRVDYQGRGEHTLVASASVAIEGGSASELPSDIQPPEIVGWKDPAGSFQAEPCLKPKAAGSYELIVGFRGSYAMTVAVDIGGIVHG